MRTRLTSNVRHLNSLKLWSAITGVALTVALVLTFLPMQVSINTGGLLSIGLRQASANPGIGDYSYKKQLTFNTTGISVTTNQTNFPICVHINTSSWPTQSERDAFFDTNTNGKRVTFYDSDESITLDYEVEYFSNVQGSEEAIYWVETPQVDGSSTTDHIHVGYGNDPFSSAQDDKAGTWASSYKFVHHLADWNVEAYKSQVYQAVAAEAYRTIEPMVIYRAGQTHPFQMWLEVNPGGVNRIYNYYSDNGIAWTSNGLASPNSFHAEHYLLWNPEGDNKYWMYAATTFGGPFALLTSSSETGFTADTANVLDKSGNASYFDQNAVYNPIVWYEEPDSTANLATTMDNSTTECDVSDTSKFAATQYIKIESEWMLVTAIVNATHCHVTRARLGTTAAAHTQPQDVYKRQWYMAYDGSWATDAPIRVGLALSYDGRAWTKQYNGSGSGGSWSLPGERHSDAGAIYKVDGVYYHCGHGNWLNNTDAGTDVQGWSYSTDLASWTALGGTGYESFIPRTKAWEGTGHTDSQTADLCGLVDNNANPVAVGGYSYFYYTARMQQSVDSGHPDSVGLVKLPGTFADCVINQVATLADSTGNNNPDLRLWLTPATGQVGSGKNWYTGAIKTMLRFPDSASHDLSTTFTFAASVYLDAYVAGGDYVFSKDLQTVGNQQFDVFLDANENNSKQPLIYYWDASNNAIGWYANAGDDMTTGWHRIAWVRESAGRKIYIDGISVAVTTIGTLAAMKQTAQPLYIGYRVDTQAVDGNLDELVIQDAAWTADWAKLDYYNAKKTNFNGDSWLSWGSQEAITPTIANTPDNYGFGILEANTTGNTAIGYFTLNNTGTCAVDVTIQGTDLTGGDDTWTLSGTATPSENIYGLYAGLDDDDDNFDVVVNATANAFVSDLAEDDSQGWGMKLYMPTSVTNYDAQQMSGTVTLIASAA